MALKLNQFIKSVVKIEEPYNLTFLFSKPTAMQLIQIQSQTQQLFAGIQEDQNTEKVTELIRYQIDTVKNHVTEISGFEDDDGKSVSIKDVSDLGDMIDRLPMGLLALVFNGFLQSLVPTETEKKS
jgi:hypothetical protein